jgi:hypothetical protein
MGKYLVPFDEQNSVLDAYCATTVDCYADLACARTSFGYGASGRNHASSASAFWRAVRSETWVSTLAAYLKCEGRPKAYCRPATFCTFPIGCGMADLALRSFGNAFFQTAVDFFSIFESPLTSEMKARWGGSRRKQGKVLPPKKYPGFRQALPVGPAEVVMTPLLEQAQPQCTSPRILTALFFYRLLLFLNRGS